MTVLIQQAKEMMIEMNYDYEKIIKTEFILIVADKSGDMDTMCTILAEIAESYLRFKNWFQ